MARTAGYGAKDASGNFYFKALGDGQIKLGNSSDDLVEVTGSIEQNGTTFQISGDDARIKINGDTDSHPGLEFRENGTRKWIIFNDYTNDNLTFKTNSTTRMSIEQAGDVGIGTTSPDEKLDVRGNLQLYGDAPELTVRRDNNADASTLQFQGSGGVVGSYIKFLGDESSAGGTNNDLALGTGASVAERMRITGDGKVGIGTTSPDYTLDVAGNIGVDEYIYHNGDADTYIKFGNDNIILKTGNRTLITAEIKSSQPHEVTINDGSNNVDFVVKGNGSNKGNPLFKCDASTGRVGINGVGSPSVELDVDGSANISGQFARGVASVNLGSGTTSTLNPATSGAGTLLVTASSITTPTSAPNEMMHICSLADGTIAGQVLTIIIVSNFLTGAGGASDMGVLLITPNTPLNSSTGIVTFTGSAAGGNPQGCTAVLMWTGSAWAILSTRRGGGSA